MELIEWAVQIKNLARSSAATLSQSASNLSYLLAYLVAIKICSTRQLRLSFLCLIACLVVSRSVIYEVLDGYQLHLVYSIIYLGGAVLLSSNNLTLRALLCCVAAFNWIMAGDAYFYAKTETWLFNNYEGITAFLHVAIICSGIDRGEITRLVDSAIGNIRRIASYSCRVLPI
jgi:hypothetical protein